MALTIDGLANVRDLGGLPLIGGGETPYGVFVRSETADRVTATGWRQLHDAGVRSVVDLRRPDEIADDERPRPAWLHTVAVDLDDHADLTFWTEDLRHRLSCTALYYLPHLSAKPDRTAAALTALADAPAGGVLFHCAGGRDRTGLVAMVLLTLAGVEPEAIVDDYLETVRRADALSLAWGLENVEPLIDTLLAERGTTTERAFRDALAGLDVDRLLDEGGVDHATRGTLRTWRGGLVR